MTDLHLQTTSQEERLARYQETPASPSRLREVLARDGAVWLVSSATLAQGLSEILRALLVRFPDFPRLFNGILPFGLHPLSRSLSLAFGFALVYLSLNLLQRKRVAWGLATAISILALLTHIGHSHLWYTALAPGAALMLLIAYRGRFTVRSELTSLAQGLALMAFSLALALAYGTAGFWLLDRRDFGINFSLVDSLLRTIREFTLMGNGDLVAHTRQARWFLESLKVLGAAAGLFGAYSLFRPLAYRLRTLPHERETLRGILAEHGRSSLDFFKLWPEKSYFFSRDQRCCIAYKTAWSVAVSLGDPVGPEEELESITAAFCRFCSDNGWGVAFYQVLPDLLPMYRRLGFQVLKIGEEAVVDLEHFSSDTINTKGFRRTRHKFEREGYTLARYLPPHPSALLDEVEQVSREWLSLPGRRERGFTLGHFQRSYLNETPLFILRERTGRVIAFVNEIPAYRPGEATIDLMRHRLEMPNGAMDYLFLGLLLALKQQGYQRFSLGLAPFAGVGERPGASIEERALHQFFEHLNRFFSYKGLRNYKAKFDPLWEERFLVYQGGPPGLVRLGIAMASLTEG
jgi:phosphatidylglycerol lysyltransferase